jgi:hypothetical protein
MPLEEMGVDGDGGGGGSGGSGTGTYGFSTDGSLSRDAELLEPLSLQMSRSLCRLVRAQCELLDQASLLSAVRSNESGSSSSSSSSSDKGCADDNTPSVPRSLSVAGSPRSLLAHIASVDDLLLLSPRSDFLLQLSAALVEGHLERFPFRATLAQQEQLLARYRDQPTLLRDLASLWSPASVAVAFSRAVKVCTVRSRDHLAHATFHIAIQAHANNQSQSQSQSQPPISPTLLRRPCDCVFSSAGLAELSASYKAPWPLGCILDSDVLTKLCLGTRRVLELGQLSALLRLLWCDLRLLKVGFRQGADRRGAGAKNGGRGQGKEKGKGPGPASSALSSPAEAQSSGFLLMCSGTSGAEGARDQSLGVTTDPIACLREMGNAFRVVQQTHRALFDFTADRLRSLQLRLRHDIHQGASEGLSGVSWAVRRYAHLLPQSLFASSDREIWSAPQAPNFHYPATALDAAANIPISRALSAVLESCRAVLRSLSYLASCAVAPGDLSAVLSELRGSVRGLQAQSALLSARARQVENAAERADAQALLMFMDC